MLLETCAGSHQHFFGCLCEAKRQCCHVRRRWTCAKPNRLPPTPCKPLARKSRFAVTGGGDKNYVSALRLIKQTHQPWSLNESLASSAFAETFFICLAHANPRSTFPCLTLAPSEMEFD